MSILIADSGATKTDWVLLDGDNTQFVQTEGLNPHLVTASEFMSILNKELKPNLMGQTVSRIYFYGSGCGSSQKKIEVEACLQESFEFSNIVVGTDLDGAGLALFGQNEGMVCILGTGSSAGLYKDGRVVKQMPSLGYPDGDEGGGSDIGKHILSLYLKEQLDEDLSSFLTNNIQIDIQALSFMLENGKEGKAFSSQTCKVMGKKSDHPQMQKVISDRFMMFLEKVCSAFPNEVKDYEIGFVGSIAMVYETELKACCTKMGLEVKSVIQSPVNYIVPHLKQK